MTEKIIELTPQKTQKQAVLAVLGVLALLGVVGIGAASWFLAPYESEIVTRTQGFLEYVVVAVVGYFTGASTPDNRPEVD